MLFKQHIFVTALYWSLSQEWDTKPLQEKLLNSTQSRCCPNTSKKFCAFVCMSVFLTYAEINVTFASTEDQHILNALSFCLRCG